ncbi:flagellar motor switch protein FliN [Ramlibacter sp.]|uniref:flagellar motor switch protein FliN n=1 Tax=Ramlibacter sp. TaxID=1917967 RepID=UPI002C886C28|nr:flagellar motor switch protein FliN [Ramlibacter sp.]HWI83382.1 flagellar motor switch protein FliN [Ramlibacter sp.]
MNEDTEDAWAAALAEQQGTPAPAGAGAPDDWAAALAEQTAAARPASVAQPAAAQVFQQIAEEPRAAAGMGMDMERIKNIPVQLTAELGRTRITIKNLLQLSQGSVVELDGLAGQPLDLFVNGYLIAQGEVVVVNDRYGIRLTDIVVPSERIQKLARS